MKKTLATIIFLLFASVAYMQTTIPKAQTLFIYNFSRLIEWPVNYRTGPFVIGVVGGVEVTMELELYTKGKKVGTQDINVVRFKTVKDITNCHILFVPFDKTKQLPEIQGMLSDKSTLIITEKAGALDEGSAINFIIVEDKLKFELKPENAQKLGIKFSSKLLEMSTQGK
jgi:hypothetical protein